MQWLKRNLRNYQLHKKSNLSYNIFMTVKKTPEEPKEIVEVDEFTQGLFSIQKEVADLFEAPVVKVLMRIAHEISVVGLSEKEAVMIAGYDYNIYLKMKNRYPIVQQLIELKDLEYKRDLLKNLSKRGKKDDDKVAQWLLEARYPNEYNKRKSGGSSGGDDGAGMIAMAIEFVRKSGEENNLVKEESGRAFLIKSKKSDDIVRDVKAVLS